jgi:hypothetical protein
VTAVRSPHALVIAAGYAVSLALYSRLPTQIPPLGRPLVALLLPTAAAVTYVLLRRLSVRHPVDPVNPLEPIAIYDAVMLRLIAFLIGVHATALFGMAGMLRGRPWAARIVPLMLGLTMVGVGNLLPRLRPNLAFGIRTARTLTDRAEWLRTHRLAGYALVALGLVLVVSGVAIPPPVGPSMIVVVAPAAAIGTLVLVFRSPRSAGAGR